jgi:hypothetical protein
MVRYRRRSLIARSALWLAAVVVLMAPAGCGVDEVSFGVGNARTEDAFGNPIMRPYELDDGLCLYRFEIEREDEPGDKEADSDEG